MFATVRDARVNIRSSGPLDLAPLQTLYDWRIRPIADDLAKGNISTIVLVLDGILDNLPMSALHDGRTYLAEALRRAQLTLLHGAYPPPRPGQPL
ncbi:CHAT domain-containing protein [Trichothermofontia sp.]